MWDVVTRAAIFGRADQAYSTSTMSSGRWYRMMSERREHSGKRSQQRQCVLASARNMESDDYNVTSDIRRSSYEDYITQAQRKSDVSAHV
jgi:hypothetical protein